MTNWVGKRFDIDLRKDNNKTDYMNGAELYDFVERLIEISDKCNCGISAKPLECSSSGNILLQNFMHLYPMLESNIGLRAKKKKMKMIYNKGKAIWREAFSINESDMCENSEMSKYLRRLKVLSF